MKRKKRFYTIMFKHKKNDTELDFVRVDYDQAICEFLRLKLTENYYDYSIYDDDGYLDVSLTYFMNKSKYSHN